MFPDVRIIIQRHIFLEEGGACLSPSGLVLSRQVNHVHFDMRKQRLTFGRQRAQMDQLEESTLDNTDGGPMKPGSHKVPPGHRQLGGDQRQLQGLAEAVDGYMGELGFTRERRRFSGHLTLGRIKNVRAGRRVHDFVETAEAVSLGVQEVNELTVFQSELQRTGPVYTVLHRQGLGAGG